MQFTHTCLVLTPWWSIVNDVEERFEEIQAFVSYSYSCVFVLYIYACPTLYSDMVEKM